MDESYFKDKISAYLDNELSPEERLIVDEYIRAHPDAQEQLARLESLKRVSDAHLSLGGDDLYWERNARKIESAIGAGSSEKVVAPQKSGWIRHGWKLTAVAASVGILFFIAINKDDIEKKALPPASPSIEKSVETTRDSVKPIVTAPLMEKAKPIQKDAEPPKRVETDGEAKVVAKQPAIKKFGLASSDQIQKEAIIANSAKETSQDIALSKSTTPAVEVAESVAPAEGVTALEDLTPDSATLTLAHWTAIRDSLAPIIASIEGKAKSQSPLSKALRAPLTTSLRETSTEATKTQVLSWLEANYHIVQMSSDVAQRVSAIETLKRYEDNADTAISAKTNEYLKRLMEH